MRGKGQKEHNILYKRQAAFSKRHEEKVQEELKERQKEREEKKREERRIAKEWRQAKINVRVAGDMCDKYNEMINERARKESNKKGYTPFTLFEFMQNFDDPNFLELPKKIKDKEEKAGKNKFKELLIEESFHGNFQANIFQERNMNEYGWLKDLDEVDSFSLMHKTRDAAIRAARQVQLKYQITGDYIFSKKY